MRLPQSIPTWAYELSLLMVAAIWGGAFVVLKDTLDAMTPAWIIAIRFVLASLVMVLAFHRRLVRYLDGSHVLAGVLVGVPEGVGFMVQNLGLAGTTPGRNAFLTATYCVMVPFLNWALLRRRPGAGSVLAAVLCLVGIGFLSLGGDTGAGLGTGDVLTLVSAVFFALNIVATGRYAPAHDSMVLTTVMFVADAVICTVWAALTEPVPDLAALPASFWMGMAYVVLFSTVLCLLIQAVALSRVPAAKGALLLSLESVFAVVFSIAFYGERVTAPLLVGFALIFAAMMVGQFGEDLRRLLRRRGVDARG